ncbi:YheC/YheD family endospore coat-associated protein [Neobacillus sp. K501]
MPRIAIIPRKSMNDNDHLVQMSPQLCKQLQLKNNQVIKLSLGKKIIIIKIITIQMMADEMLLPENLFFALCLPIQSYHFQYHYIKESRTLYLGPVIGLLTDFKIEANEEPYFRSIHGFCEELNDGTNENGGFFYVFSYPEFEIQGYYFKDGKWDSSDLPLPDVIYNRIHSRKVEYTQDFKFFREKLAQLNIPFFNDRFLSKWEVHEYLNHENHICAQIPETKLFTKENLLDAASKYETVFIKPVHGSQGRNIFKLTKSEGLYLLKSSAKNSVTPTDLCTIEEIYHYLKPHLNNRIYIIQQGIPLITFESRSMDFRVLCHKNTENLWKVTSVVARISAEEEFVSNLARGGDMMTPLQALSRVMNKNDAKTVLSQMKALALETASSISLHSSGLMGELGIDIGIDQAGKPWLIEVNSKPSKNFEDDQKKIRPSAKAIIQFCTMLAFNTIVEKED